MPSRITWLLAGASFWLSAPASAADEPNPELTEPALQSWLSAEPDAADASTSDADLGPPLLPPRRHGWAFEGSVGALGHLGNMRRVSPVAPWFRLQVGYEPLDWLMLLAQGDLSFSSTSLGQRPPEVRGYALFGLGVGVRFAWQPFEALGFFLQGDAGAASVTEDVLASYGYPDADRLRPFAGGSLGVDWFQLSPHYALSLSGGARDYFHTFDRINGDRPPWVWHAAVAIRYVL